MRYAYPANLEPQREGFSLHFDGLPGATWGGARDEALEHGRDLLVTAIEMLIDDGEEVPPQPPSDGRPVVEV